MIRFVKTSFCFAVLCVVVSCSYGGGYDRASHSPAAGRSTATSEVYEWFRSNSIHITERSPVAALATHTGTSAYAVTRRFLRNRTLPPYHAVRIEELINYFPGDVPRPTQGPLQISSDVFTTPWNPDTLLLHIEMQARELGESE